MAEGRHPQPPASRGTTRPGTIRSSRASLLPVIPIEVRLEEVIARRVDHFRAEEAQRLLDHRLVKEIRPRGGDARRRRYAAPERVIDEVGGFLSRVDEVEGADIDGVDRG